MNRHHLHGSGHLTRRAFVRVGAGLVAGLLAGRARLRDAVARDGSGMAGMLDVCYWKTYQTECRDGRKYEYRCEICCAGGVCETVQCAWFDVGAC